jgi:single-strand DNA-binding protein
MTQVAIRGNTTAPVELRFTSSGKAVGNVTVAVNRGKDDTKATDFYRVTLWQELAENAAQLEKGTSVLVIGRMQSREYEAADGSKRTVWEVTAEAFGPDLRFQSATVARTTAVGGRSGGSGGDGAWDTVSVPQSGAQQWGGGSDESPF